MSITKTSVKRPLTIIMVYLIVLMFGAIGYSKMPASIMPDIDIPVVFVSTLWPGAGPEDIDTEISKDLEKALSSVSNVKNTSATSSEGMSFVAAQFEYGTDVDELLNTIRSKVDAVSAGFPDDVEKPSVQKYDINSQAISYLVVKGNGSADDIMNYAEETVQSKLESVDGVNSADIQGGDKTQINVVADPSILSNYGVTIDTIKNVLSAANKSVPYGSITQGEDSITIRGVDKINSLEEVKAIQIPVKQGQVVSLDKICSVDYGLKEKSSIQRYNGEETLRIDVKKQQDANSVQIMRKVEKAVDELNTENDQYNVEIVYSEADYINNSINDVLKNILISSVIAFAIILAFLKSGRASFVVAVSIPTSIIGAIALLYLTGETVNMVTLSSLVIAVGMVVDSAIVVIENIFKYRRDETLALDDAAIMGTNTVTNAVIASTLTTVGIFLPIIFTEGFTKIMFGALAKTLIFALTLSLIVAVTLVPSLFAKLSGGKNGAKLKEKESPIFDKVSEVYKKLLVYSLKHKVFVILVSVGMFIGSFALGFSGLIGMDFMSMGDMGMIQINVTAPEGLDLEPTEYYMSQVEEKVIDIPEISAILSEVDKSSGFVFIKLTPNTQRDRSADEIEQDVVERLKVVPDCEINVGQGSNSGNGEVSIKLDGPDIDVLEEIGRQAEANIKQLDGFRNVKTTISDSKKEAQFKIDKRKAQMYGVNTATIGSTLRTAVSGSDTTNIIIDGYNMDVNLKFNQDSINSIDDIKQIKVTSTTGQEVPLSAFADLEIADGVKSVSRTDGNYSITVSAKADNMDTLKANNLASEAIEKIDMPKNYGVEVSGEAKQMNESMGGLVTSLFIGIILVYMIMVAQFESFSRPFIIMFCIPFAFVGVVLALIISRISLNVIGMLGAILLVGIVVNNGIVLIDYIDQLRKSKLELSLEELVAKGASARLRPVLMTTLTTVIGMVPSALAFGEGGDMMQPLSIVVIGGLSLSTLVTLVLIPTVYLIFDKIESSLKHRIVRVFGKIKLPKIKFKKSKMDIKILTKDIIDKDNSKKEESKKDDSDLKK